MEEIMFGIGAGGYDNLKGQFSKIREKFFSSEAKSASSPVEAYQQVVLKKLPHKPYGEDRERNMAYGVEKDRMSRKDSAIHREIRDREILDLQESLGRFPTADEIEDAVTVEIDRRAKLRVERQFEESNAMASRAAVFTRKD